MWRVQERQHRRVDDVAAELRADQAAVAVGRTSMVKKTLGLPLCSDEVAEVDASDRELQSTR